MGRKHPHCRGHFRQVNSELGDDGRILVRPSGTEPLIRVMAEGPDEVELERIVDDIAAVIEHEMGEVTE